MKLSKPAKTEQLSHRETAFFLRALDEQAIYHGFTKANGTANRVVFMRWCINKADPQVQRKARQYAEEAQQ